MIRRMHEFVREAEVTPDEWEAAMGFLMRAAEASSEQRNEFILLSDLLGVSALVDLQDGKDDPDASITTVIGPFYVPGTPEAETGADLIGDNDGERVVVEGQVRNTKGEPVSGATRTAPTASIPCRIRSSPSTTCAAPCTPTNRAATASPP